MYLCRLVEIVGEKERKGDAELGGDEGRKTEGKKERRKERKKERKKEWNRMVTS